MGSGPQLTCPASLRPLLELEHRGVSEERGAEHPEGFLVHCPAGVHRTLTHFLCIQWVPPGTSVTVEEEKSTVCCFPLVCTVCPSSAPAHEFHSSKVWAGLVDQLLVTLLGASQEYLISGGSCRADSCLFPVLSSTSHPTLCCVLHSQGKHIASPRPPS